MNKSRVKKHMITFEVDEEKKKALLIFPESEKQSDSERVRREEELRSLASTMGVIPLDNSLFFTVREINSATYLGKGQLETIEENIRFYSPDLLIFDISLSPRVARNLEEKLDICAIDREEVILQIFRDRATTKEAVLQVSLARAEYSLPRLRRRWASLSQQRGGVRGSKGEGEKQLELDRRKLEEQIAKLKKQLEEVKKVRSIQRKERINSKTYSFAIVGYTNAGKSSLMNALSGASTLVENKLFATLDTTTRQITLKERIKATISDTVGFVSNLPHNLVSAFSSTLEEATFASCLIIVVDSSSPNVEEEYNTTLSVLSSLGCSDSEKIIVFNKIDMPASDEIGLSRLRVALPSRIEISVKNGINLEELKNAMTEKAKKDLVDEFIHLKADENEKIGELYKKYTVLSADYKEDEVIFHIERFK